ncbi:multifunctional methyltransferase subunit TRM112-like protein [Trichomycterus rosablanca]|uniref:multifunctional methyltransferase subunit TRM112-like protein n=1 Tax=Trichomycterus rosablanca TaxID=2290929 RepID=UPI002F351947
MKRRKKKALFSSRWRTRASFFCLRTEAPAMKLLTHNMLTSHVKGVTKGYPLLIKATEVQTKEVEFNPQFVSRMIPKLEWSALVQAAGGLGYTQDLPTAPVSDYENDEDFLRKVHKILLEVEVIEGTLQCPESGREFPISRGVPNMLLNDDES